MTLKIHSITEKNKNYKSSKKKKLELEIFIFIDLLKPLLVKELHAF